MNKTDWVRGVQRQEDRWGPYCKVPGGELGQDGSSGKVVSRAPVGGPRHCACPTLKGLLLPYFQPRRPGRGVPRSSQEAQPTASSFWAPLQSPLPSAHAPEQATFPEHTGTHQPVPRLSPGCATLGPLLCSFSPPPPRLGLRPSEVRVWEAALAPCPPTEAILGARQLPTDTDSGPTLQRCPHPCYLVSKQRGCCSHFRLFVHSFIHATNMYRSPSVMEPAPQGAWGAPVGT